MPKPKRAGAVRAWTNKLPSGRLSRITCIDRESAEFFDGQPVRVVIIRESDYRKLLKAASTPKPSRRKAELRKVKDD